MPVSNPTQSATPNPLASYDYSRNSSGIRSSIPASANLNNAARPVEVFHLPDSASASIPADIRAQFHRDEHNRVLFFTAPPYNVPAVPDASKNLGHSLKYRAAKLRERFAAKSQNENAADATVGLKLENGNSNLGTKRKDGPAMTDGQGEEIKRSRLNPLEIWSAQITAGTEEIYKNLYGTEWKTVMDAEGVRLAAVQETERARAAESERREREREEAKKIDLGRWGLF